MATATAISIKVKPRSAVARVSSTVGGGALASAGHSRRWLFVRTQVRSAALSSGRTSRLPLALARAASSDAVRRQALPSFPTFLVEADLARPAKPTRRTVNDTTYASPFSWRYARPSLRELFSERERRKLWRAVWV
ncbi:MAG: hypothetical protein JWM87_4118, partial [Candidatus Eremiobacteraeota bacterium]|nr:hypothetical protein [Candidatus Eremiobacteraeota bacterium]